MEKECGCVRSERIEGREYRDVEGIIHQRADGTWIMPIPKRAIDPDNFSPRQGARALMAPRVDWCPFCGGKLPEDSPARDNPHD